MSTCNDIIDYTIDEIRTHNSVAVAAWELEQKLSTNFKPKPQDSEPDSSCVPEIQQLLKTKIEDDLSFVQTHFVIIKQTNK